MARTLTQAGPERANRLIFIGAIALAALAAVLVFFALSNWGDSGTSKSDTTAKGATVSVVVASRDIAAGVKISDDMLSVTSLAASGSVTGAITDKAALLGLTTRYPLQKNQQFSTAVLGQAGKDATVFAAVVPAGKRAIALPISETTGVGGLIVAGDHVDITAIIDKNVAGQVSQASTLLQNVLVLAVAQTSQKATTRLDANGNPIADAPVAGRPENTNAHPDARSITVAVDPQEVALIALAQEKGKIYLSLRSPDDAAAVPGVEIPRALPNP
jgi:pilus assembly protein CpaB